MSSEDGQRAELQFRFDPIAWNVEADPIYGGPMRIGDETGVYDLPVALVICDSCKTGRRLLCNTFDEYFAAGAVKCPYPTCDASIDLVRCLVHPYLNDRYDNYYPLALAGAMTTMFWVPLKEDEVARVVLSEFGVPDDALCLEMDYATRVEDPLPADAASPWDPGFLVAVEDAANVRPRRYVPREVELITRKEGRPPHRRSSAQVRVAWIRENQLPPAFQSYLLAARLLYELQGAAALTWANTAVESALYSLIYAQLRQHAGRDRVERFLTDGATYSHQMNVVLPLLASFSDWPELSDDVRGQLNALNGHRNRIVHEGITFDNFKEAGVLLVYALVALHYFRYVESLCTASTARSDALRAGLRRH